jgi:RND superfamily putative drug exporter
MRLSPRSLARSCSHRPWRTVAIWLVAVVASGMVISSFLADALTTDVDLTNRPEAKRAQTLLEERMRGEERAVEMVIVSSEATTVDDPDFRAHVERLERHLVALGPGRVTSTHTYFDSGEEGLVSKDRHTTLVRTELAGPKYEANEHIPAIREVLAANRTEGLNNQTFGLASLNEDFNTVAEEDLRSGEGFGIMAALIILVVVFGALVAAVLPIFVALTAIAVSVGLVALVGQTYHFSFFVTNVITMMGLAVGIDYSLFVVSRYREERRAGREKLEAIEAAGGTASRAVFFSGMTVVLALAGMLLIPNTIFRSVGAGAIFVVVAAVIASLTLLPAVLGLLGDKVNAVRIRRHSGEPRQGGFWDGVTRGVMGRPVVFLLLGAGLLLVVGSFAFQMRTGFSGVSTVPNDLPSKQAFDTLSRDFPGGVSSPVEILVDGRVSAPVQAGIDRLRDRLATDSFFGPSEVQVNPAGDLSLVSAPLRGDPNSKAAVTAIARVRDDYVPAAFPPGTGAEVLVGGDTAFNKDFFEMAAFYLPLVFSFVLGLSFVLLTVAFRSIVVPIKAIALNLLSVMAAYGLIVLVSQKGVGADILGFQQVEVIDAWIPLFLFSILFGLSMDYHVFLLSRIRERFDHSGDNTESVAYGLRTTAGIITGAALIMVAVFAGFASGRMVAFQQMGFGLAAAVLIDATIVRSVLVPATMKLLGNRNWYLPRWLQWLPRVQVEEAPAEAPAPRLAAAGDGMGRVPTVTVERGDGGRGSTVVTGQPEREPTEQSPPG